MMSFSSASTSAARAHTSTSRRSASSSATTRTSAVTRPWIVSSSAAHPVPGTSDATSLVSMPWRNAARSAPVARTTVRKPRSTTAAPSRNAAYSAAGSSPKRRGSTTPRSLACTAPRAARCECSAVSSIALAAMRRPLRLDKRPTAGDPAPVAWRDRVTTAEEALGVVRPGDTVAVAAFSNTPHTLCRALAARAGALGGVRVDHLASLFPCDPDTIALTTNYATAADRAAVNAGRVAYLPVSHWHADALPPGVSPAPDVYLVPVSPPDAEGRCSFGTGAWFSPVYCRAARTVIGEVHEDFIRTGGDSWAPVERFRHLVPADEPTGMAATAPRSEEETAATEVICTLVAHELVRDRDTLQVGIGTVSSALGLYLDHRHDLGVQSEAITGGIPDLVRRGVVTGRHKVLHPGVVVGSFMLGLTPEELAFVDGHPGFALYGFGSTDDVSTLLRERNLTAVNNALLVDLTYEDILYEAPDGVAWITINRPEVRNAFRAKTVDELIAAFRAAWGDPEVGVVVLTGAGDKAFSAGGDQRERTGGGYTGGTGLGMDMHGLHGVIRAIPKPVIAMVNGYAIGGGHVLHVPCDLTIAADTAVFGQTGPRVGSVDPGFGTAYLARVVGEKK